MESARYSFLRLPNRDLEGFYCLTRVGFGSGSTFAWDRFKVPSLCTNKGWLLAGGLCPENVANAISTLRPNAVDVAGGIAGADGIRKDPLRIHAFMEAVRASSGSYVCTGVGH